MVFDLKFSDSLQAYPILLVLKIDAIAFTFLSSNFLITMTFLSQSLQVGFTLETAVEYDKERPLS